MQGLAQENERFVISRKQEEEWAAQHSRITRILGWCLIAGFVFTLVSAFFTDHLHLDLLMIIGGFSILQGSQAWLRFFIFMTSVKVLGLTGEIITPIIRQEPIEIARKWMDYHHIEFWQEMVLPIGLYLALGILCLATLRSRKLVFWTTICKRWIIGFATVAAIIFCITLIPSQTKENHEELIRLAEPSLAAVEDYAKAYGSSFSAPYQSLKNKMEADPLIQQVTLSNSPNASMTLFDRDDRSVYDVDADYQKFIKGPAGEWILIKVNFKKP